LDNKRRCDDQPQAGHCPSHSPKRQAERGETQGDCIFLATKQRTSHEFRELRENNEETTYFAKEATARNTRTRKQQRGRPSLLFLRNLLSSLFTCLQLLFSRNSRNSWLSVLNLMRLP
jgi:hypothetical protein